MSELNKLVSMINKNKHKSSNRNKPPPPPRNRHKPTKPSGPKPLLTISTPSKSTSSRHIHPEKFKSFSSNYSMESYSTTTSNKSNSNSTSNDHSLNNISLPSLPSPRTPNRSRSPPKRKIQSPHSQQFSPRSRDQLNSKLPIPQRHRDRSKKPKPPHAKNRAHSPPTSRDGHPITSLLETNTIPKLAQSQSGLYHLPSPRAHVHLTQKPKDGDGDGDGGATSNTNYYPYPHKFLKKHNTEKILPTSKSTQAGQQTHDHIPTPRGQRPADQDGYDVAKGKGHSKSARNILVLNSDNLKRHNAAKQAHSKNNLLLSKPRSPRDRSKPISPIPYNATRSNRSSSTFSNDSNYSYSQSRRSSTSSNGRTRRKSSGSDSPEYKKKIECICGRKMDYTQNPHDKYPPGAILYCQQSTRCKKKIVVAKDWFYCCKARTSYHGTQDGKFKICYSCSISNAAKQERIRKNHQLLIKQLKNKHRGKVMITKDTKDYILSSTSSNSKDETLRLLKSTYIDQNDRKQLFGKSSKKSVSYTGDGIGGKKRSTMSCGSMDLSKSHREILKKLKQDKNKASVQIIDGVSYRVIKEGYMMKKGNIWNKAFKKRYFRLLENKRLYYYKYNEESMEITDERGYADLNIVNDMNKKGKNGLEIDTPSREWKLLCNSHSEREEWYNTVKYLCMGPKDKLKKSKTYNNMIIKTKIAKNDNKHKNNKDKKKRPKLKPSKTALNLRSET